MNTAHQLNEFPKWAADKLQQAPLGEWIHLQRSLYGKRIDEHSAIMETRHPAVGTFYAGPEQLD